MLVTSPKAEIPSCGFQYGAAHDVGVIAAPKGQLPMVLNGLCNYGLSWQRRTNSHVMVSPFGSRDDSVLLTDVDAFHSTVCVKASQSFE